MVQVTHNVTLNNITQFNIFWLDVNFDKFTVRLNYLYILSMLAKFQDDQILIVRSSINFKRYEVQSLSILKTNWYFGLIIKRYHREQMS